MEEWTTIRYLHAQGKGIRAIATELSVARQTVRRALQDETKPKYVRPPRPNPKLEPYQATIRELYFGQHLIGSRIFRELRKLGYRGGNTALYTYLRSLRQAEPSGKATMRFETAPGQQAQFDWSPYTVEIGGELRRVVVYGLTLGYSRRKHYTASFDERAPSIYEAIEESLWHFGGSPKELLVDNPKAFVLDANPKHFRWNPQFLELCGHYRIRPRACRPAWPRTKGKIERPFAYLEEQFIKGGSWHSLGHFLEELAIFEREDLDLRVHSTTQERPIDRFAREQGELTSLPEQRFVGTKALTRKVSWDCLVPFRGNRYSVPAMYAGKLVWLLLSHGSSLVILNSRRELLVEHAIEIGRGKTIILPEHYEPLRRGTPRTWVMLAQRFLELFPHHADFLEGLTAQHKLNPAAHLRGVMQLTSLYSDANLRWAFDVAAEYNTFSHTFVRGLLESGAAPAPADSRTAAVTLPDTSIRADLKPYQRLLWAAGR